MHESYTGLEIAIIGMSGRFPKADTLSEFWDNLIHGRESIEFLSEREIEALGLDDSIVKNPNYVPAGTRIRNVEAFDASFFGFSPKEVVIMDPQQKVFLECAWEAIENAGYDIQRCNRNIGVFAGENMNTYILHILKNKPALFQEIDDVQAEIGNDKDYLSSRVSYKLGLEGPSMTIQSACSSSLVAVHTACRSLLAGECDMALAGGICIRVPQIKGYIYQEGGLFSKDGHCRPFDKAAQGSVFGSGAGIVLLKRLEDAIQDNDHIYAVIKGSAINNDGKNKVGYAAPSVDGQANVVKDAQEFAEVHPRTISYVEAHGTATKIGDPIEVSALNEVFRDKTSDKHFCALGSVKSNIGHLGAASGIVGLIKTVLAMEHQIIPPTLHFTAPNPELNLADSPFYINTKPEHWNVQNGTLRRAGVSSFGVGGTNAHLILEEYPQQRYIPENTPEEQLILLSAKTQESLQAYKQSLKEFIANKSDLRLCDIIYNLAMGRSAFACRFACTANSMEELSKKLENPYEIEIKHHGDKKRKIAFLFPGQGIQYVNMGLELYNKEPVFRKFMDCCLQHLLEYTGVEYRDFLFAEETPESNRKLTSTVYAQPLMFCLEYSLAKTLMEYGIEPDIMVGHSLGEYVAAALSNVFSLKQALQIVLERAKRMQAMPQGSMLSILQPVEAVRGTLTEGLSIAADNMVNSCVVSGPPDIVQEYAGKLDELGWFHKMLNTSHAYHSRMMEPAAKSFRSFLDGFQMNRPNKPYISNLYGKQMDCQVTAEYWAEHMLSTVRFRESIEPLMNKGYIFMEVGPGKSLINAVQKSAAQLGHEVDIVQCLADKKSGFTQDSILALMGKLWARGANLSWEMLFGKQKFNRIALPTYPYQRKRYWLDVASVKQEPSDSERNVQEFLYQPCWNIYDGMLKEKNNAENVLRVAVVFYRTTEQRSMIKKLPYQGKLVLVHLGTQAFQRQTGSSYCLKLDCPEEYAQLFATLKEEGIHVTDILYLASAFDSSGDLLDFAQRQKFYSIYYFALSSIAKAIKKNKIVHEICIFVFTNNAFMVNSEQKICNYEKSIIRGVCIVGQQEYTNLRFGLLDLENPNDLASVVLSRKLSVKESVIAYRGGKVYQLRYEKCECRNEQARTTLRKNGTYLITGGYGGIAVTLAEYIIHQVKATLILVGRRKLCPKSEWEVWLKKNQSHPDYNIIKNMFELERLGSVVEYVQADMADVNQLKQLILTLQNDHVKINGIIHCAGIFGSGEIEYAENTSVCNVLDTKIVSAKLLCDFAVEIQPDFVILCSSLSAVLGGIGNADYSAANQYYDQIANYLNSSKQLCISSVNWDEWQEVGMAERLKRKREKQAIMVSQTVSEE